MSTFGFQASLYLLMVPPGQTADTQQRVVVGKVKHSHSWVYILPNAQGGGVGIIRVFSMNSRQDKEFSEKNAFFG